MIIVDIEGRLGNQMFQYTFAHGIAKVLNTRFSLNPIYKNELFKYFALDKAAFFSFGLGLKLNLFLKWSKKFKIIHQNGWQNNIPIEDNVHYKGFFQSELFFQENKDIIRNYFTIKKYWVDKFNEKYQDLF